MAQYDMEDVLSGVTDYLDANLTTYLAAIESVRSCTVPRPKEIDYSIVLSRQYPFIEVLPGETEPDYGQGDNPFAVGFDRHSLYVNIHHAGGAHKDVELVLIRYFEAIKDLVIADDTLGGAFNEVQRGRIDYSSMIEAIEGKQIKQTGTMELLVW